MMHQPVSQQTRNDTQMKKDVARELQTVTNPVEKLRLVCLQQGSTGILALGRLFRRMDVNASGDLRREEFRKGLDDSGMGGYLTEKDYDILFEQFDVDGSGGIKFDEFMRTMRTFFFTHAQTGVTKGHDVKFDEFVRAVLPRMKREREALVLKAFDKMDHKGKGQVSYEDIREFYNVKKQAEYLNGQRSEKELLTSFLRNFEDGGTVNGIITKEEFLDYYAGVSASIEEDGYFDLMMRTCWRF